jgi:hypothetical protein
MDMITPNWRPLELFHIENPYVFDMEDFMWMHRNDTIECYKHRTTRSYLNIDNNGLFWLYLNGRYREASKNRALQSLFRLD